MAAAHRLTAVSDPLRVLFILDNFSGPQAGTEGQFWLLFRNLDRARFAPAIMLLRPSEFLREHVPANELKVLNVQRLLSPVSIIKLLRAAWWARRNGYKVVHIFFNDSAIVFPIPLKLLGIRVIVSRRDLGFWYTPRKLTLLKFVARFVDRVVANCEAVRAAVVRAEKFPRERVEVIYNGIGRETGETTPLSRGEFAISAGARVIVIVANLRPLKRIDDAVRMLAGLQAAVGDTHLVVVGEDRNTDRGVSHQAELQQLANDLGIANKLHFAGKMNDPMPAIAMADLCILCSETEGLSNTVIEYMLAGKASVCTDVGGNSELLEHGQTGYLVGVGDIDAMTRAAAELLGDRQRAASFGERARRRALSMFTARAMVQKQTELYQQLAISTDAALRASPEA